MYSQRRSQFLTQVSIPKGEATNADIKQRILGQIRVSIPKGEATNASVTFKSLANCFVSIPKGEATNEYVDRYEIEEDEEFQSPKGRLQTPLMLLD